MEESGRPEEAAEAYIDLLDDPLTPLDEQDYVRVGLVRTWLSLGEPETALAVAREVKLTDTGSKRLMTQLEVQALRALGRDDEADAFGLELAVEEEDDEVSQAMAEANDLLNEWDFEGSIRAYETLLPTVDDRPTQAAIDTSIAQALALSGDLDSARSRYGRVLRVYRDDPEAVFGAEMGLAWLLRMDGDPEGAIDRYERLVPPDPGSAVWRDEQLARAFVESGQSGEAEALYKRMLDEHAGDRQAEATARSGLAELLQANDELRAARALYTWVADNAPDSTQRSWASLHAAMLLVDEGQLDVAEEALDDLLDHEDPEVQLQAAVGLSAIELERGRPRRGLDVLDEVDPDTLGGAWVATWNLQRTSCLLELGRPDEARQGWEEVLNRYADNDDVASQARLALGDVALGQDRSDDAIDWYLEVLETTPDRHYQARALLGLVQAGQTDRCEQALSYEEQGELLDVARIYCD
jgi:tetratricopeptide (TPR) repeat protein